MDSEDKAAVLMFSIIGAIFISLGIASVVKDLMGAVCP